MATVPHIISNISTPEKYVGYADLPNQIYRHCAINGFHFNLIVVGESGLGKSTFVNNLFSTDIYIPVKYSEKAPPISNQAMEIRSSTVTITENGVPLKLTMIDTPGFGDCINNSECSEKVAAFVDSCSQEYLDWDNSSHRSPIHDMRVHCCIYFISPNGHKLKPLDIEILTKLCGKTSVIPVIAKADTLTPDGLLHFKKRILEDLKLNNINTYTISESLLHDTEDKGVVEDYVSRIPFAIVSSDYMADIKGKQVRCRKYPWGICEVDNLNHSDFVALRNLLLRTCTCDLITLTDTHFYEIYRSKRLSQIQLSGGSGPQSPLNILEQEKNKQATRLAEAKKELNLKLLKRQEELVALIKEKQAEISKISQQESDLIKIVYNPDQHAPSDNSNLSKESSVNEDKRKDKKKKIF